ncbi:MAG: LEA type 2 family protein [Thiobacillus sp.]|uniref:LEA type 2 family protein n=1 Tax=Thiobacillus sp. TaxID=924 RepID=UPI00168C947D|nr:LEA type 2 family protein [Thiobacillus sp.]QLQ03156.1 MAG: LEA type 2 family protein [Thiobacillus sp.]
MLQRLFILVLALGLAACSGLPFNAVAPKVSVADVAVKRLGFFEQRFDVGLRVSNPNDFDLTIEALDFELEVNGQPFASGLSQTSTRIAATSSTLLRIDATTQSKDLIRQIESLSPESLKAGVPYRIHGRLKTDRSPNWVPFDHAGVYGGDKEKPEGHPV